MWELRGEYRRVGEKRGKGRKRTDVPLQSPPLQRHDIMTYKDL
jgi:hypothetical protein